MKIGDFLMNCLCAWTFVQDCINTIFKEQYNSVILYSFGIFWLLFIILGRIKKTCLSKLIKSAKIGFVNALQKLLQDNGKLCGLFRDPPQPANFKEINKSGMLQTQRLKMPLGVWCPFLIYTLFCQTFRLNFPNIFQSQNL